MGVGVSSSHAVSAAPSSSGGGLLTLCPCSSARSLSQETVLHELLQCGSLPWGAVLQEQAAPAWALHGVTASLGHPPTPVWGPFHGLQMDICSTVDLHGLWGDRLPQHGLLQGLQGNLCPGSWSTSSPSFFTDHGVCKVVSLTYSCSSLSTAPVFLSPSS